MTIEEIIKVIGHTIQDCPRKRQAPGALSHSNPDHEHLTSYETLCYKGNENKARTKNLIQEIKHLRMKNKEEKCLIKNLNREAAEMVQTCGTITNDNQRKDRVI